jgi:hypothetical protein
MRGAILPIPQYAFMEWCLVKHRDNFTLPLPLTSMKVGVFIPMRFRLLENKALFWSENLKGRKISLGKTGRSCKNKIKGDLTEIGYERVDWTQTPQNKVLRRASVITAMSQQFP